MRPVDLLYWLTHATNKIFNLPTPNGHSWFGSANHGARETIGAENNQPPNYARRYGDAKHRTTRAIDCPSIPTE